MPRPNAKLKVAKRVVLETRFAGIAAGSVLFVATPEIVAAYIARIPAGASKSIEQMRRELARRHKSDATCPVSTAIFVRQVAEHALRLLAEGSARDAVTPFWRVVAPGTAIAKRLPVDDDWIASQLALDRVFADQG